LIKSYITALIVIITGLAFLFSLLGTGASGSLDKNLDYGKFLADISRISEETHFIGSPGHARLQGWLQETIIEIGKDSPQFELRVDEFGGLRLLDLIAKTGREILDGEIVDENSWAFPPLKNFIVTARGANPSKKALMIVSHYDGAGGRPGESGAIYPAATDAGIYVAAMLEVMRYAANNPVENDVIFLFTDGEEAGLLGAQRFMERLENPAEKIGLVANFDAAGTSGTLVMFETGAYAAGTVRSFAKIAGRVYSNSITTWLYERMSNGTDMTVFKKYGLAGLNFACVGHGQHYHTPDDNMENLNEALAKQTLNTALSMYTFYGNYDFEKIAVEQDLVYFNLYHFGLIILPVWAVYTLVGLMAAGIIAIIAMKHKDFSWEFFKRNSFRHLKAACVTLFSVAAAIIVTYLISWILDAITGIWLAKKYSAFGIVFGTMLIAMVLFTFTQFFLCRHYKVTKQDAFVFAAIWQFLLTAALLFALPASSFIFLLPAVLNVAALVLENTVKNKTALTIIKDLHLPVLSAAFAFTTVVTLSILAAYAFGTLIAPFAAVLPLFALCAFPTLLNRFLLKPER